MITVSYMFLAKKLTSKMTYFLRINTEVEIPYFTFYVINHSVYDHLLQYLKQNKIICLATC